MPQSADVNQVQATKTFSLLKRAVLWLLVLVVVLAVVAGIYSYHTSYHEVSDFQKDNLKNIALLIVEHENDDEDIQHTQHRHYRTEDQDGGLLIDVLKKEHKKVVNGANEGFESAGQQPPTALTPIQIEAIPKGLSHQKIGDDTWQVYRLNDDDKIVIVRQSSDLQDDLAQSSTWQVVLPVLVGMMLFSVLLAWVMWKLFLPLRLLSVQVRSRHSHDLRPLHTRVLPQELAPFVDSINQLLGQVTADIERQQRFIADVSHELRSPLTAISLQLQRLQQLPTDAKMQQGLAKLSLRVKRNQDLVEQLLTLAKIDQAPSAEQTVLLRPVIEQSIQLLLPLIDAKNLNMQLDIAPDKAFTRVLANETAILILIKNLLQNAVLYTPENGYISIRLVKVQAWERQLRDNSVQIIGTQSVRNLLENACLLQIIDSGAGMDVEQYHRAFDAFVRLSVEDTERSDVAQQQSEQKNGTGLGLALVKSICIKLGIQLYLSPSQHSSHNPTQNRGLCVSLVFLGAASES